MARSYKLKSASDGEGATHLDYAAELNPEQFAAVTAPPGPALVIAGAGSGKTRTLTYRVAFLIEQGVPPSRILLLTFTNKAAREMLERVTALIPHDLRDLWGGTFHSIGNRILRRHAEMLGYGRGFSIMDREDQEKLIGSVLDTMGISTKEKKFPKPSVLASIFSLAVNTGDGVREVVATRHDYFDHLTDEIEAVHQAYEERKLTVNVMDFDDLLVRVLELFKQQPSIADSYREQFKYLLVDEYQDTNSIQAQFVATLALKHGNVMAVGDDAQAIYSWRGADCRNVLDFSKHYPGAVLHKIETNYRSRPEILEVANAAISANEAQFEKSLVAVREPAQLKPVLVTAADSNQQARFVVQRIGELEQEGIALSDIAILYRAHYHSMEMQMELTRHGVPFQITSGLRFFEQAHVKDVTAFMKFVVNPRDEVSFLRMVSLIEGIGDKTAARLWKIVFSRVAKAPDAEGRWVTDFEALVGGCKVPARSADAWKQLGYTLAELAPEGVPETPSRMIRSVVEAIYSDYIEAKFTNADSRKEDLNTLAGFAEQYRDADELLAQLSLLTNLENETIREDPQGGEMVNLSSIHQAKGLEWKVVFVICLCDGMFPIGRAIESDEALEEERRLFYVALTRAMDQLYISWPMIRSNVGYGDNMQQPSRFLNELPEQTLDEWDVEPVF